MKSLNWLLLVAFSLLGALSGCSDEPETKGPVVERSGVEKPASPPVERLANSEDRVRSVTSTDALPATGEPDDELLQELEKGSDAAFDKVFSEGQKLTEDQAKSLEERLQQNPKDLLTRFRLVGYYSPRKGKNREQKTTLMRKYAPLVMGIIENHPESNLAGMTGMLLLARSFEMGDQGDWDKGLKLWMKLVDENPTNAQIMGQAATYISWDVFRPQDKALSLLEKACELDPENSSWAARLGSLLLHQAKLRPDERRTTAQKALGYLDRAVQLRGAEDATSCASLTEAAFLAEEWEKTTTYGNKALARLDPTKKVFGFADLLHNTHVLLGRVAVRDGNLDLAKQHLLEAGKTSGSPTLNSYGPDMNLARELLETGEKETVLQYFELCRKFWKLGGERLDLWVKAVEQGKMPDFKGTRQY